MEKTTSIWKRSPLPWLLGWLLLNLLQASISELARDEAYYWAYAQYLSWGYFDHPPAIALLIKIGSSLIPGELGVRIFPVLMTTVVHLLCFRIVKPKNLPLYFCLAFSPMLLHMAGFIATPDAAILFTATLFFYLYKQYLSEDSYKTALLLALILAGMGYSKYDGVLVLLLAFFAEVKIAKRGSFWVMLLVATLLYLPHLYWQYSREWMTIRFHLAERMPEPYSYLFPLSFIGGQLLVYGGLVSPLVFWAAYKKKADDTFEKALRFVAIGLLVFFFLMTLKGRVEANWTISIFLPLVYLSYHYLKDKREMHRWVYRLSLLSVVLILTFRLYLLVEFVPRSWTERDEFHGWPEYSEQLAEAAEGRPVIFYSTYAYSSMYWFYSKQPAYAFSTLNYNGNQYDLWTDLQEDLQGKEVFVLSNYFTPDYDTILLDNRIFPYKIAKNYHSYNRLKIELSLENPLEANEERELQISLHNPTNTKVDFTENTEEVQFRYDFFKDNKFISGENVAAPSLNKLTLNPGETVNFPLAITAPKTAGTFRFRVGLKSGWQPAGRNMSFIKCEVKNNIKLNELRQ